MQAETKRSRIADPFLAEIDQEAAITKRLLDIIPEDKLSFRPHPKAKSLGELAMHVATIPGNRVSGRLLHYYVEARDAKEKVAASNGKATSPNVVTVRPAGSLTAAKGRGKR